MITDARYLGDSIAALNWDSMFKPGHLATNGVTRDQAHKADMQKTAPMGTIDIAILRAARQVAEWRTYLPEDCVAAMINDGWHWTT
jgi:hypothetical protein